jgi:glycine/D-amino acid oxidase-like deaminating enzyme
MIKAGFQTCLFAFFASVHYDYIIIGQGIAGSFLSYYLLAAGKKVLVIDKDSPNSSSKVASGLINPVTGKRIVTTWMADQLIPFAQETYKRLEQQLSVPFITQTDIIEFHPIREERELYDERIAEGNDYLKQIKDEAAWQSYFRFNYGLHLITPCLLIDLQTLLTTWRSHLKSINALRTERFDIDDSKVSDDGIRYKDIKAEKIIFCDGTSGFDNPYFSLLPYTKNKGDALILSIPDLPRTNIYKQGIKIIPWKEDLFWVGASFEWKFDDLHPTPAYREKIKAQLDYWLKLPYNIEDHIASERPTTVGQMPFVGLHPIHTNVGVMNGMGTKGCSLAPFLAYQFAQHLVSAKELMPEVDVKRFSRVLSR